MLLKKLNKYLSKFFIYLINLYCRFISPLKPDTCIFIPSCSQYSVSAFKKYGFFKGFYLSIWRIIRCNPWNKGGIDILK